MIELAQAFREVESGGEKFDILDFDCEYCHQIFNSFSFNLSVFLYGAFFLSGDGVFYAGITCPKCLKTILMKGNTLARLQQGMLHFTGPDNRYYSPDYRYHSSVLYTPALLDQLQGFNIRTREIQLDENFSSQLSFYLQENSELEKDYLASFKFVENIPIGKMASIWWYKPEDIVSLVEIENKHQIRVFPRYIHNMSWYEKYDDFCWAYKLNREYWAEREKAVEKSNDLLREYAREENINLDRLYEDDPGAARKGFTENLVTNTEEDEVMLAPSFLDLLINSDSNTQDIVLETMNVYKNLWKTKSPFEKKQVPKSEESLGKKKIAPGISENEFKEIAGDIRPYITKSHVQAWAIENHQHFIDDFIAIARRSDFSYGYVWELKCRYLKQLHDNLDKSSVSEAQYAFFSEGPTWTIIFNGKVLRGLRGGGFKYIEYLIKNPGKRFHITQLHEIIFGAAVEALPDGDKTADETSEDNTLDGDDAEKSDETAGDNESNLDYIARELGINFKGVSRHKKIDHQFYADYKTIIFNLNKEIEEARKKGDISTENQKKDDRDKIRSFFLKDIGLGGRPREFRDENTKIKDKIAIAISRAISEINKDDPEMAEHFKKSLTPIYSFQQCYHPDIEINWQFKD